MTLRDCLFADVELIKNADLHKFGYIGYSIRLDTGATFLSSGGKFGKNIISFFGEDNT